MRCTAKVGAIVLAAGASSRMGFAKLAAPIAGKPMIAHVVDAIDAAGLPAPLVVLGGHGEAVRAALAERACSFVEAADWNEGLSRSLAAGLEAVPDDRSAALVCLGDMPLVSPDLLRAMAARGGEDAIVLPQHAGRRGNPVLWGKNYFAALRAIRGDIGGKALFREHAARIETIEWPDDSVLRDFDTPDALARLGETG